MSKAILAAIVVASVGAFASPNSVLADSGGYFEVAGVEGDGMLKLRAGPGTGFKIIVGLPNGTILRNHGCQQTGGTRWCEVSLKQARRLKGFVSSAYLRKN